MSSVKRSVEQPASRLQTTPDARWLRRAIAVLPYIAVMLYGALAFHQYDLPGLYYDEAFDVVPAMQLLNGESVNLARGVGINVMGRDFPVMIGDYWGIVSTYAVLPLFAVFGVGVFAIRLWTIVAGMLAVYLTFIVGRRLYGPSAGAIASLLLAIFPSFVFWSRTGIYVISHIITIVLAITYCYMQWRATKRRRWLLAATFLSGVGLSTKLLFAWFLIAVPAAYAILVLSDVLYERAWRTSGRSQWQLSSIRRRIEPDIPITGGFDIALSALTFVIGAFPVIYYNIASQGSYQVFRANLFATERGVNNFAIMANLRTELDALRVLLNGGYFWYYGGIYVNPIYPWVTMLSTALLVYLTHRVHPFKHMRRSVVFFIGFCGVTFLLSCFSVSILGPTHLLILLPVPQLFIATAIVCGIGWLKDTARQLSYIQSVGAIIAVIVLASVLMIRDLWVDRSYHQALARSGGQSAFSSAIYTLADDLDRRGVQHPYALDWGFKYPIMILTDGRVEPLEIFGTGFEPDESFEEAVRMALQDPEPVFISHNEEASTVPRLDAFNTILAEEGCTDVSKQTIQQLDGKPVYYLFVVRCR